MFLSITLYQYEQKGVKMAAEVLVHRPSYIDRLKTSHKQTDLVKIVTGARRCGSQEAKPNTIK